MEDRAVTLWEVLEAREQRVRLQQLLLRHGCSVMCFTMNIPGPVKDTPLIRRGFREGMALFEQAVPVFVERQVHIAPTGAVALYAVDMDAAQLKKRCVAIEEASRLGRLFDMDVLDARGSKPERGSSRGCMVCGAPGRLCAAQRAHSVETLQQVTCRILEEYFLPIDAARTAQQAVKALLEEVNATPKPGLVDRRNNGSHPDMDLALFTASAHSLEGYFQTCFSLGATTGEAELFPALQQAGLEAERTMYQTTGGVNTHKGAIFTLGILCGSLGQLWQADGTLPPAGRVLAGAAAFAAPGLRQALAAATGATHGEQLYLSRGITGARGEAAAGFPSVALALTLLRSQKDDPDRLPKTLLQLIARVEDTNLLHRGGAEGAQWAARQARALLPDPTRAQLEALDDAFIARRLSPGGCADLLAAAVFLDRCTIDDTNV